MRTSAALQRSVSCIVPFVVAACAASAPDPSQSHGQATDDGKPAGTPSASTLSASAPSAIPAPASAAAQAAPAAGNERRYLRLHPAGASDPQVWLSIDVPSLWGVRLQAPTGGASFHPCHADMLGHLSVQQVACTDGLDACIARIEDLPGTKQEKISPSRVWASRDGEVNGRRQVSGTLYVVDEPTHTTIACSAFGLEGSDLPLLEKYKAACSSLTVRPPSPPEAPTGAVAARPSPEDLVHPQAPREKAMTSVALGFVAAAAKRDARGARAFLATERHCPAGSVGETCRKKAAQASSELPQLLEKVPSPFEAGSIAQHDGSRDERVVWVTVFRRGDECANGITLPVVEFEGKFFVMAWALRKL